MNANYLTPYVDSDVKCSCYLLLLGLLFLYQTCFKTNYCWVMFTLGFCNPYAMTWKMLLLFAWVVDDAKCVVVTRVCVSVCVCVCVCLSAAARPHYCTDPDVTWVIGGDCPLVVHYWVDLQSVHGFRCCLPKPQFWGLNRHFQAKLVRSKTCMLSKLLHWFQSNFAQW